MLGRIGRYDVERLIGSGGMGVVFKAYDTELNRPVAIKLLAPFLAESGSARKRFAREARAAAAVVDEHVVAIHNVEAGDDPKKPPFLVMKFIAGGSLQQRLDRDGPLDVCEILRIGMQTAKGLAAAHGQGLIHRDVKPSNILLDEGVERALLTDFGLARAEDDACLTRSGFHPGTPHYMSPEQVRGEAIDVRSDLFGLGCVLYAMCTGHPPFRAETSYAVLRRITDDPARPIRELNANIPEWLERIVMKLLSKSPTDRFDSAEEVAELLEDCLAHVQHPTTTPLPIRVQALAAQTQMRPNGLIESNEKNRLKAGFQQIPPVGKFIAAAAFTFSLIFAGVLIVLEMNKGTLTIECEADNVPVRIRQGDTEVERLTVTRSGASVRVKAGTYIVEIDGAVDGIEIEHGTVELRRRETRVVRIVQSQKVARDTDLSNLDGELQILISGRPGIQVASNRGKTTLELPGRLNIRGTSEVFTLTRTPEVATIYGTLHRQQFSEQAERFLEQHAVSLEITPDDLHATSDGTLTKYVYLPHQQSHEKWAGHFGTLTMGSVDGESDKAVRKNLQQRGELLVVCQLWQKPVPGTVDWHAATSVTFYLSGANSEAVRKTNDFARDVASRTRVSVEDWDPTSINREKPFITLVFYSEPNRDRIIALVDGIRNLGLPEVGLLFRLDAASKPWDQLIIETPALLAQAELKSLWDYLKDQPDYEIFAPAGNVIQTPAKSRADERALNAVTAAYNESTRQFRLELFDPPIPDLTTQQMRAAMLDAAKEYRRQGKVEIASALEQSVENDRLAEGLTFGGTMGTASHTFRQVMPGLIFKNGPSQSSVVCLSKAELRYSRDGWSSSTWGDIHPPLEGTWDLVAIEPHGKTLAPESFSHWKQQHTGWTRIVVDDKSLSMAGDEMAVYDFVIDYQAVPVPAFRISQEGETKYEGVLMGNGFVDDTTLQIAVDIEGHSKPKTFHTDDDKTTRLTYRRVIDALESKATSTRGQETQVSEPDDAISQEATGFPSDAVLQEMHDLLAEETRLNLDLRYVQQFLEGGKLYDEADISRKQQNARRKEQLETRLQEITNRLKLIHESELGELRKVAENASLECSEEPLYGQSSYGVIVYAQTTERIQMDELLLFHAGALYRTRGTICPLRTTGSGFFLRPNVGIPADRHIALACIQDAEEENENVNNGFMPDSDRARNPSRAYRANVFDRQSGKPIQTEETATAISDDLKRQPGISPTIHPKLVEIRTQGHAALESIETIQYRFEKKDDQGWQTNAEFYADPIRFRVNRKDVTGIMSLDDDLNPMRNPPMTISSAFDGQIQQYVRQNEPVRIKHGRAGASYGITIPQIWVYGWLRNGAEEFHWDTILSEELWERRFREAIYIGDVLEDGRRFEIVDFPQRLEQVTPCIYRVYFARDLAFLPLKVFRSTLIGNELSTTTNVTRFKTFTVNGNQIAIPLEIQRRETQADGVSYKGEMTILVDESSLRINHPLDDSLFTLNDHNQTPAANQ
jgi:serine/threonine protein kinase